MLLFVVRRKTGKKKKNRYETVDMAMQQIAAAQPRAMSQVPEVKYSNEPGKLVLEESWAVARQMHTLLCYVCPTCTGHEYIANTWTAPPPPE